jgi:uncharacterized integral membrane protein
MSDTWIKIKIWTKLVLIGLAVIFVAIFVIENYSHAATVWLFGNHEMSVLEALVAAFILGVAVTVLARPIYRTLGQISELRKKQPPVVTHEPPPNPAPTPPPAAHNP